MTTPRVPPRKILVVLGDRDNESALRSAAALADRHGASLEAFCCVEAPHDLSIIARLAGGAPEALFEKLCLERKADALRQISTHLPGRDVALTFKTGKTFFEIVRYVIEREFDFVIKRAEPLTGLQRLVFASTDQHLLRKCPCPVWLQTATTDGLSRRVIAAVDVDIADAAEPDTLMSLNRSVIDVAHSVASGDDARIMVLHAWDAVGEGMLWAFSSDAGMRASADAYVVQIQQERHAAMQRLLSDLGDPGKQQSTEALVPRVLRRSAETVIQEQCKAFDADVVVMGTVARTGVRGVIIGNTAENMINSLDCPVVAVKPEGFISPLAE